MWSLTHLDKKQKLGYYFTMGRVKFALMQILNNFFFFFFLNLETRIPQTLKRFLNEIVPSCGRTVE